MEFTQNNQQNIQTNANNLNLQLLCRAPQSRIHSKGGLFSTILKQQKPEVRNIKEDIIRLSYSFKCVGVLDGQIGISSKRLPLRVKQKQYQNQIGQKPVLNQQIINHNGFISQRLQTVKKNKQIILEQKLQGNQIKKQSDHNKIIKPCFQELNIKRSKSFSMNTTAKTKFRSPTKLIAQNTFYNIKSQQIPTKNKSSFTSSNNFRPFHAFSKQKYEQISKTQPRNQKYSNNKSKKIGLTKSYSRLLIQMNGLSKNLQKIVKLQPLQHENRMLQQIKRISNLTPIKYINKGSLTGKIAYLKGYDDKMDRKQELEQI